MSLVARSSARGGTGASAECRRRLRRTLHTHHQPPSLPAAAPAPQLKSIGMGPRSGFVVMNQTEEARATRMDDVARISARLFPASQLGACAACAAASGPRLRTTPTRRGRA